MLQKSFLFCFKKVRVIRWLINTTKKVLCLMAFFCAILVPFMNNVISNVAAQVLWCPSFLFLVIGVIRFTRAKDKVCNNSLLTRLAKICSLIFLVFIPSAFIVNYYTTPYTWWWVVFVMVAMAAPLFALSVYKQEATEKSERKRMNVVAARFIAFYWLLDLFYMSIFMYHQSLEGARGRWLVWQFIFGILATMIVFYNLVQAFLRSERKNAFWLIADFVAGIAITIYLIFIIPNEALQETVLTIIAAVFGGVTTLIGVAWTIRDSNLKRREDLKRIEREKSENERRANIPYIRLSPEKKDADYRIDASTLGCRRLWNEEEMATCDYKLKEININTFWIKNVSRSPIVLKGICIYDKPVEFSHQKIIEPGSTCPITITEKLQVPFRCFEPNIHILIADIFGNEYKIECESTREALSPYQHSDSIGGGEYEIFQYPPFTVTSVGLPILLDGVSRDTP